MEAEQTRTFLDRIVAYKRNEIAIAKTHILEIELRQRLADAPPSHDFLAALQQEHVALIAEVKRASPSKGVIVQEFHSVNIATEYATHGAAAISVLTDENFFQGHLDYLRQIHREVKLPVLRKEFILDPYQVYESRVAGADALLLIVACLEKSLLSDLHALTCELGMAALIEVHDEKEMETALALSPRLIGINNRNLHTFHVDLETTAHLAGLCPPEVTLVSESGIFTADDVRKVASAGASAILVGEAILTAENRSQKIQELVGVKRR